MADSAFYTDHYTKQKKHKILRSIELISCMTCTALAVTTFSIRLHFITKVLLMVVAIVFTLVTLLDVIAWLTSRPMGHKTWVASSVAAFHMYCLCGGFLVFVKRETYGTLLQVVWGLNVITGCLFLFDFLVVLVQYILWVEKKENAVAPIKVFVDRSVSPGSVESEIIFRRSRPRSPITLKPRLYGLPSHSYGGTFSVSRDVPPLPTPEPLRKPTIKRRMPCTLTDRYIDMEGSGDFHRVGHIPLGEIPEWFKNPCATNYVQKSSV